MLSTSMLARHAVTLAAHGGGEIPLRLMGRWWWFAFPPQEPQFVLSLPCILNIPLVDITYALIFGLAAGGVIYFDRMPRRVPMILEELELDDIRQMIWDVTRGAITYIPPKLLEFCQFVNFVLITTQVTTWKEAFAKYKQTFGG